jgi:hypothetical protein
VSNPKKRHIATTTPFIIAANLGVTFLFAAILLSISVILADWLFVGVLTTICLYVFISGVTKAFKERYKIYLIIAMGSLIMGGAQIVAILVRWDYWLSRYRSHDFSKLYDESYDVGAWIPISIVVLVAALVSTQVYSLHTKNNRFRSLGKSRYE